MASMQEHQEGEQNVDAQLGIVDAYLEAWRRAVDFSGTSTRKEFFVFVGINLLALTAVSIVLGLLGATFIEWWFLVWFIVLLVPSFSLTLRRVRDSTGSGWWTLLLLIPYLGLVFVLFITFMPTRGSGGPFGVAPDLQLNQYRNPNYLTAWRRTFDLFGVSTRTEYWSFTLITLAIGLLALIALALVNASLSDNIYQESGSIFEWFMLIFGVVGVALLLIAIIPSFTVTIRRVRDATGSGWWVLLGLIPFVGGLIILVITLMPTSGR